MAEIPSRKYEFGKLGRPPEKLVSLQPVRQKLQLERVGLAASSQVVVELGEEILFKFSNSVHLRYEAAHEVVVVVVREQVESLIGDGHWVAIGTRRSTFTGQRIF